MKNTTGDPTTMIFVGSIMLDAALYIYLYRDIYHNVEGGSEARNHAGLEVKRKIMRTAIYGVAFALASWDYFSIGSSVDSDIAPPAGNLWPIFLVITEFILESVGYNLVEVFVYIPRTGRSHKEFYVPINLEFVIHRIGEWVMLMLGESVLSILTSKGEDSWQYSISFFCGLLTITILQYLFFRSQPSEAKDHAMRRSQWGEFLWMYMHTIYSAYLILVGCSYKMMLSLDEMEEEADKNGRRPNLQFEPKDCIHLCNQPVHILPFPGLYAAVPSRSAAELSQIFPISWWPVCSHSMGNSGLQPHAASWYADWIESDPRPASAEHCRLFARVWTSDASNHRDEVLPNNCGRHGTCNKI
jgi:Bacterial low temperature requirement A protein (LtrA)